MNMVRDSIKAFKAEWIKLKGTGTWWILIIGSLINPLLAVVGSFLAASGAENRTLTNWESELGSGLQGFTFLYLLLNILYAVRLCQTEDRAQGWKLIETQPLHRAYLFLAKFKMLLVLSLLSLFVFLFFLVLVNYGAAKFGMNKELLDQSFPLGGVISHVTRIWISAWGMMAIQYLLSLTFANFALPFLAGFVLSVAGMGMGFTNSFPWFPYAAPASAAANFNGGITGGWLLHQEKLSIAWMFLFLWLGYQLYIRRSWKIALLGKGQLLKLLPALALFALAFFLIERPSVASRHQATVISGMITDTSKSNNTLLLLDPLFRDTIMTIPLNRGSFNARYPGKDLPPDYYLLKLGTRALRIYLGQNDSIHIVWNTGEQRPPKITGTRIAENAMNGSWSFDDYGGVMQRSPPEFARSVNEQWENDMKDIERFRTVENVKPSADFLTTKKKQATISYLRALRIDYPRGFSMFSAADTLKYPSSLDKLFATLDLNDTLMLRDEEYLNLLEAELRYSKGLRQYDYDSSFFNALIADQRPQRVKSALLYKGLKGMINNNGDSLARSNLFNRYIVFQEDPRLEKKLRERLALENTLVKGLPAPLFYAYNLAGKKLGLGDMSGKWIVVDVWATWCAPCKRESPFFEQYAEMYGSDKVNFVSLSVDAPEDMYRWQYEAGTKSRSVMQLRAVSKDDFMSQYGIEFIPRFLLIDPKGKIAMANLPRPSERAFEEILRREVNF